MAMKILFVSLGCDKNRVDAEKMLGLLSGQGWQLTDDELEADVIVINTCCFINEAKEESIRNILEYARCKEEGHCRALICTGCMAQRYAEEIREELPEVDAVVGTTAYDRIAEVIQEALSDKHCTYCAIPSMRGPYRSVPREILIREAEDLASKGVKELILVAQETTLYGTDLYGRRCLHELIRDLAQIRGIFWIRVLYCYPEEIYEDLIRCMKTEKKFLHYLDLPIQHANDEILRRMGRRTTRKDLKRIIRHLRDEIPDIVLRTTLITGFPGESREQFEDVCRFINEMEFNRLGVFPYSQEEGTPAAQLPDQIDEETKLSRMDELMELQQEIAFDLENEMIGREMDVMIEGQVAGENAYIARSYGDAPDVDGYVFLNTDETLVTGDFARVRITGASDYDLIGELL